MKPFHTFWPLQPARAASLLLLGMAVLVAPSQAGKIHEAVLRRDAKAVKAILAETPALAFARDYQESATPLHLAAEMGDPQMVKILLTAGAQPWASDMNGKPAWWGVLHFVPPKEISAAFKARLGVDDKESEVAKLKIVSELREKHAKEQESRVQALALLLETKPDVQQALPSEGGNTPLHAVVIGGNVSAMEKLLAAGAKCDATDGIGRAPLHRAAVIAPSETVEFLIAHGAKIDAKTSKGQTPLIAAAANGRADNVAALLKGGARATEEDKDGWTALHYALKAKAPAVVDLLCEKEGENVVRDVKPGDVFALAAQAGVIRVGEMLVKRGVDVDARSRSNNTPLLEAARHGQLEFARWLLARNARLDAENDEKIGVLAAGCAGGNLDLVREIMARLPAPVDIDHRDNEGYTPLLSAVEHGHLNIVRFLLEKGASATVTTKDGRNAMAIAVYRGTPEMFEMLLKAGAKVEETDRSGCNAVFHAALNGRPNQLAWLLANGGKMTVKNQLGYSALMAALGGPQLALMAKQSGEYVPYTGTEEDFGRVAELLVAAGARVDEEMGKSSPLCIAAGTQGPAFIKALIKAGASISETNPMIGTPLHAAAAADRPDNIAVLCDAGMKPDARSQDKLEPLHAAVRIGAASATAALIKRGAPLSSKDNALGYTPLHFAVQLNWPECVRLLLEAGADPNAKDRYGVNPIIVSVCRKTNLQALSGDTSMPQDLLRQVANAPARADIVRRLLQYRADTTLPARMQFKSIVDLARDQETPETIPFLEQHARRSAR